MPISSEPQGYFKFSIHKAARQLPWSTETLNLKQSTAFQPMFEPYILLEKNTWPGTFEHSLVKFRIDTSYCLS